MNREVLHIDFNQNLVAYPHEGETYQVTGGDLVKVQLSRDDRNDMHVATINRFGCDAACVWVVRGDGRQEIIMTHYEPELQYERELAALSKELPLVDIIDRVYSVYITSMRIDNPILNQFEHILRTNTNYHTDVIVIEFNNRDIGMWQEYSRNQDLFQLHAIQSEGNRYMEFTDRRINII